MEIVISRRGKGNAGCVSFISVSMPMHTVAGSPWEASPCFWRQHSKVECLCLHSNVPAHSEWAEGFASPCVLEPLTTPCLLLRTEIPSCLVFQVVCGSVLQWEWSCWFSPTTMALGFPTLSLKCRAENCPTVHLPSTNSSDTVCPLLLLLHLDVALSINLTSVMHNIFKTKII